MLRFKLTGWRNFSFRKDLSVTYRWLLKVGNRAEAAMIAGMRGPHSGRVAYRRDGGGRFQRSTPSEYPAVDSGALIASLKTQTERDRVTVGTNVPHSKFLREGTKKMARRKMSDDALKRGKQMHHLTGWVAWHRGKQIK